MRAVDLEPCTLSCGHTHPGPRTLARTDSVIELEAWLEASSISAVVLGTLPIDQVRLRAAIELSDWSSRVAVSEVSHVRTRLARRAPLGNMSQCAMFVVYFLYLFPVFVCRMCIYQLNKIKNVKK